MTKYTLQDKIAHLESFSTSGLKRIEYAALHNINFNSFKCWPYFVKQALLAQSTEQLADSVDASYCFTPAIRIRQKLVRFDYSKVR